MNPETRRPYSERSRPSRLHHCRPAWITRIMLLSAIALGAYTCTLHHSDDAHWTSLTRENTEGNQEYSLKKVTSRYLTMRDGTDIAIDLYLPDKLDPGKRVPSLLRQSRYCRSFTLQPPFSLFWADKAYAPKLLRAVPQYFVTHGYAWVEADVRGSGASSGTRPYPFSPEEIRDGAEIVDWIITQPWSNGKVGALGTSYGGITAELLLANNHPAVKAIAPRFSGFDIYTDLIFPGGIHLEWLTDTWGRLSAALDRDAPQDFFGWLVKVYVKGVRPVDTDRDRSLLAQAVRSHEGNFDVRSNLEFVTFRDDESPLLPGIRIDDFSPHTHVEEIKASGAAIYSYSGWFDGACQHGAIKRHMAIDTPGSRLTLGPWIHGGQRNHSPTGNHRESSFDHYQELLRFFDYHLKGLPNGIEDEPPIHYYTMEEEQWKTAYQWPPAGSKSLSYYLAGDNCLSLDQPNTEEAYDVYQVNHSTGTGTSSRWKILIGGKYYVIYPNRRIQDRKLLTYTSGPLYRDMEVTGHPLITLFVSSPATDGQFFVYLEDVDIYGKVNYVTEGQLRAIHRRLSQPPLGYRTAVPYRSFKKEDALPLVPGEVNELVFDLLPTSYLFKQGHSIRVALAGADKDHFSPLPGDPPLIRFYRDEAHASRIELPVIPNDRGYPARNSRFR